MDGWVTALSYPKLLRYYFGPGIGKEWETMVNNDIITIIINNECMISMHSLLILFAECLQGARHCTSCFTYNVSFYPHMPFEVGVIYYPHFTEEAADSE